MEIEEAEVIPPPKDECSKQKWGFLPILIDKIVQRRKKCKKAMKNALILPADTSNAET